MNHHFLSVHSHFHVHVVHLNHHKIIVQSKSFVLYHHHHFGHSGLSPIPQQKVSLPWLIFDLLILYFIIII